MTDKLVELYNMAYGLNTGGENQSPERQLELLRNNIAVWQKRVIKRAQSMDDTDVRTACIELLTDLQYFTGITFTALKRPDHDMGLDVEPMSPQLKEAVERLTEDNHGVYLEFAKRLEKLEAITDEHRN